MLLLEETLAWDGYLFADVRTLVSTDAQSVWHVLNGEVFALDADHGASLLIYLDALRPLQWTENQLESVVTAPELDIG